VTITKAGSVECKEGGTHFKNATGEGSACNGEASESLGGESGLPVTLPGGKTETGTWGARFDNEEQTLEYGEGTEAKAFEVEGKIVKVKGKTEGTTLVAISFPIPLPGGLTGFGEGT